MVTSTSQAPRAFDLAFCILTCSNLFRPFFLGYTFNCSGVVVEIINNSNWFVINRPVTMPAAQDITEKLEEQESRQAELNHYVKMVLPDFFAYQLSNQEFTEFIFSPRSHCVQDLMKKN